MAESLQLNGSFYLYASGKPNELLNFEDSEEGSLEFTEGKLKFPCGLAIPSENIKSIKYRFMDNHHLIEIGTQLGNFFYFNVSNESKSQHQAYVDNLKSAIGLTPSRIDASANMLNTSSSNNGVGDNIDNAIGLGKAVFSIFNALSDD